jgi:hypothetical protein
MVQARVRGRRQRLGRLPHRTNPPVRYGHALCHGQKAEPVDGVVYRKKGFQQPWFLVRSAGLGVLAANRRGDPVVSPAHAH